jgi:hypothetical protein
MEILGIKKHEYLEALDSWDLRIEPIEEKEGASRLDPLLRGGVVAASVDWVFLGGRN